METLNTGEQGLTQKNSKEQTVLPFFLDSNRGKVSEILRMSEQEKIDVIVYMNKLTHEVGSDKYGGFVDLTHDILSRWDLNAKCPNGWTLLMYAAENGCMYLARLLVQNGVDVKMRDNDGDTASKIAKKAKNEDIADFLSRVNV